MVARLVIPPGTRFGRLTVTGEGPGRSIPGKNYLKRTLTCNCDCGSRGVDVILELLTKDLTKSCGCLRREKSAARMRGNLGVKPEPGRAELLKRIAFLETEVQRLNMELGAARQELDVAYGYRR